MTQAPPFSIKESLLFGWEALKAHHRVFLLIVFISVAISFVIERINTEGTFTALVGTSTALGILADMIIALGLTKIGLKITAGEPITFDDMFSATHLFFSYIGAVILYTLMVLGGFLLLVVPGLIWLVSYWLFPYALVDKEDGALAALSEAKRISKGVRWHLFLFMLVSGILNVAGALVFFVGLFITVPVTTVAAAYIYRILQKRSEPEPIAGIVPKDTHEKTLQAVSPKPIPMHQEEIKEE